jgi:hypothetical protein
VHTEEKNAHPAEAPQLHTTKHATTKPAYTDPNVITSKILTIWREHKPLEKVGFSNQAIW